MPNRTDDHVPQRGDVWQRRTAGKPATEVAYVKSVEEGRVGFRRDPMAGPATHHLPIGYFRKNFDFRGRLVTGTELEQQANPTP